MTSPAEHTCRPAVRFDHLSFGYDGRVVIDDASVTICEHDFVSVIGPNGSGKTTLLKLMLGLLQPTSGKLEVLGTSPAVARPRVGYVAQLVQFDPRFPVSVLDVALMGRLATLGSWGRWSPEDHDKAMAALDEVSLTDLVHRPFEALSGGQRQRVLIARALAGEPELLLLDEATSNLDVKVEAELFDLLCRLNERMTIVIVSHDLSLVVDCIKSVLCVRKKVHIHPTSELTGELIREMYGGDVRMVRHDHRCSEGGHFTCGHS